MSIDRTLFPAALLLVAGFVLFELTGIDLWVQDFCYDFARHAWLVDKTAPLPRLLFYDGPKFAIAVLGIVMAALALFRHKLRGPRLPSRRDLLVCVLTLAAAPSLVALGKAVTNVHCPYQIERYGGNVPYLKVCQRFPEDARPEKRGRGFPAGHASGGFALVALAGLARSRRGQLAGFLAGQAAGWTMGVYQILKGAHYLSHNVFTAFLCWLMFLAIRRLCGAALPLPAPVRRVACEPSGGLPAASACGSARMGP